MNAILIIVGFFALSGTASIGYILGGLLASNRLKELQMAYARLSRAIHEFLGDCPVAGFGMMILGDDDMVTLRNTLIATDAIAGWTIEDYRR